MQKLKKINLDKLKEFMFIHGEKVALATCATLALLIGLLGINSAMNASKDQKSGKPWNEALKGASQAISASMASAKPTPLTPAEKKKLDTRFYGWDRWESHFVPTLYSWLSDVGASNKRENPIPISNTLPAPY